MSLIKGSTDSPSPPGPGSVIPVKVNSDGELMAASHTALTTSDRVEEIDPVSQHYASAQDSAANQTDGNTYYYYNMAGYQYFAVQVDDTPGVAGDQTYTVEATVTDDGTPHGSCTYVDVTNALYGVANLVTSGMLHPAIALVCKYVRVKVVRANDGANNDGAWTIDTKRMY